jgi:hypothetical protein
MALPDAITASQLSRRIGTADAPLVLDVPGLALRLAQII